MPLTESGHLVEDWLGPAQHFKRLTAVGSYEIKKSAGILRGIQSGKKSGKLGLVTLILDNETLAQIDLTLGDPRIIWSTAIHFKMHLKIVVTGTGPFDLSVLFD